MENGTTAPNAPKKSKNRTTPSKNLPQRNINYQLKKLISDDSDLMEVVCLTSFPPRECGIATYSKDLGQVLSNTFGGTFKLRMIPLETGAVKHTLSLIHI